MKRLFFVKLQSKDFCLICKDTVAVSKEYNTKSIIRKSKFVLWNES